jgi:hypothetical protein
MVLCCVLFNVTHTIKLFAVHQMIASKAWLSLDKILNLLALQSDYLPEK